ncbi:MAG: sigma-70 family RNA polymerase sigma factor [Deltaproteobacteria bacterium]|nr:sigma-70 family RNA polymerase sigma factor [Deltaproteobacteria bacterium]
MSVARPETKGSTPIAPAAPDGDGEVEARDATDESPPSSEGDLDERSPPVPSRLPPSAQLVNTRISDASNAKQARIREAEEDRGLIARAQQGDTAAFRSLVERHQRRAFAIALALVRDENDARELVQDAFLRVYKGLDNFQGGSSFFTWLYRIITNLSIDLIRKPGRQLVDIDETRFESDDAQEADFPLLSRVDGSDPADVVRRREIARRLQVALDALPPYHRGVIVMREIEGLSYEEMATAMGVSKGTIMSRLFHARQKLQKALADCYTEQIGPVPDSEAGASRARDDDEKEGDA